MRILRLSSTIKLELLLVFACLLGGGSGVFACANDTIPPSVNCPPSQTLTFQSGQCGSTAFWTTPQATDNCSSVTLTSSHNSGDFFGPGTTVVTYTATDSSGNNSSCIFFITVNGFPLVLSVDADTLPGGVNIACAGDSTGIAVAQGFDGCPPYSFLWSNGATSDTATGLPAGWISVTITDGQGFSITDSVLLTEPPPFAATLPAIPDVCGQDSATFTVAVTGGSEIGRKYCTRPLGSSIETCFPESSPGMIEVGPLPAGTYIGTASDTLGCPITDTFTINSLPLPLPNLPPSATECTGDPVVLDAGNPGSSYLWSTGDTTQILSTFQSGVISVLVTAANGCTGEDSTTVNFATTAVASFTFMPAAGNQTFDFADLSTGDIDSLRWDFGDGGTSTLPNPIYTYQNTGNFTACLTAFGPCGTDSACLPINVVNTLPALKAPHLSIIPNPSRDRVKIQWEIPYSEMVYLKIWDMNGKLRLEIPTNGADLEKVLDLSEFAAGMYLLSFQTREMRGEEPGRFFCERIIINR